MKKVEKVLVVIVIIAYVTFILFRKNNQNSFSSCIITKSNKSHTKSYVKYLYRIDNTTYEGSIRGINRQAEVGDKFIITYDSLNPNNHCPIFNMRYFSEKQIDSLSRTSSPQTAGSLWRFNPNNSDIVQVD